MSLSYHFVTSFHLSHKVNHGLSPNLADRVILTLLWKIKKINLRKHSPQGNGVTFESKLWPSSPKMSCLDCCCGDPTPLSAWKWVLHVTPVGLTNSTSRATIATASNGLSQRSTGVSVVLMFVYVNKRYVSCVCVLQSGQSGVGCVSGDILYR